METHTVLNPFRGSTPTSQGVKGGRHQTYPLGLCVSVVEALSQSGVCPGLWRGLTVLGFVSSFLCVCLYGFLYAWVCVWESVHANVCAHIYSWRPHITLCESVQYVHSVLCSSIASNLDFVCVCVLGFAFSFLSSSSWETIFSKSSEVVSPQELQCCRRLVQLCRDCLLVVYKFVSESRGSLTGLSPEWDDTRWDGHPTLWCIHTGFLIFFERFLLQ